MRKARPLDVIGRLEFLGLGLDECIAKLSVVESSAHALAGDDEHGEGRGVALLVGEAMAAIAKTREAIDVVVQDLQSDVSRRRGRPG